MLRIIIVMVALGVSLFTLFNLFPTQAVVLANDGSQVGPDYIPCERPSCGAIFDHKSLCQTHWVYVSPCPTGPGSVYETDYHWEVYCNLGRYKGANTGYEAKCSVGGPPPLNYDPCETTC